MANTERIHREGKIENVTAEQALESLSPSIVGTSISVIIASKGRPDFVRDTIKSLQRQTLKPSDIVVVAPAAPDLPPNEWPDRVRYILGSVGLTAQRNRGLAAIPLTVPYVAFFDDDFELKEDYLEQAVVFLNANVSVMGLSGRLLGDGVRGLDRPRAREMIAGYRPWDSPAGMFYSRGKHHLLFGCNMVIRRAILDYEKFDENLPLYSYGEDYDISIRLESYGPVGRFVGCVGVHLETPSGRVREELRGYSLIANNWYFIKKGVTHLPFLKAWARFWVVCVGKTLLQSVLQQLKGDRSQNWKARMHGQLLALQDIFQGRCHPRRIQEI
jgi:GT2 family glycosyltransferase